MTSALYIEVLPQAAHLAFYQGDDWAFDVSVADPDDGSAMDVSAVDPQAQIRLAPHATDTLAEFTIDMTDAATGTLHLSLDHTVTATLPESSVWDLQFSSPIITTVAAGNVQCIQEVTR